MGAYMRKGAASITSCRQLLCRLLASLLILLTAAPGTTQAACVCSSGRMTNYFPVTAPIVIDGATSDWNSVISDPHNNICDGSPGSTLVDLDAPIQSTGRDLEQFTYTYDANYVYAMTKRYASSTNTDKFIYYADTNNNGLMETGEAVIVVAWQGNNREVDLYLGSYRSYYPGGDPLACTPGYKAGQACTTAYADGYKLPGTIENLPAAGNPTYTGSWGSTTGTEMEWAVTWSDLGVTPGTAFSFHVSSTNSQPGASSFPGQVDDNMGGCGGGVGTTQYAAQTLTPDQTVTLTANQSYSTTHILTNTGNGNDNFTLTSAVTGSPAPIPTVTYYYNGVAFTDTSTLGAGFAIARGASITLTTQFSFGSSPAYKNYSVTTTAASKFDSAVTAQAVDTLFSEPQKPNLLVSKSADAAGVDPGQVVTYTVQVTNTAGTATSVVVSDLLSSHTALGGDSYGAGAPFQFVDGAAAAASGVTLGTPAYSQDNGATWGYLLGVTGFDGNVTNWKIPMVGSMKEWSGAPDPYPSFSIKYRALAR